MIGKIKMLPISLYIEKSKFYEGEMNGYIAHNVSVRRL